jgi:rfaE bifunctional protein nucleotidyltransferase chain/domain
MEAPPRRSGADTLDQRRFIDDARRRMCRKILTRTSLRRRIAALRRQGRRIVFTNGCFDLLHPGHVRYLGRARRLGDVLVVGVNSDRSARRLGKGTGRPVQPAADRAEVLAALEAVDYVSIFDEDTPLELIRLVEPDVLVKGGDWPLERIVGADLVRARGGRVRSLSFAAGYSTTRLIRRLARTAGGHPGRLRGGGRRGSRSRSSPAS